MQKASPASLLRCLWVVLRQQQGRMSSSESSKSETLQRRLCVFKLPSCHWVTALVGKPHSNITAINETSEQREMSSSRHGQQPEKGHHHLASLGKWAPAPVPKHSHKGCRVRLLRVQKSFPYLLLQVSELGSRGLMLWICRGESWCCPLAHQPLALPWISVKPLLENLKVCVSKRSLAGNKAPER